MRAAVLGLAGPMERAIKCNSSRLLARADRYADPGAPGQLGGVGFVDLSRKPTDTCGPKG